MTPDREKRSEGLLRLFKKARGVLLDLWGTSFANYLLLCPDLTERQPSEELLTLTLVVPIQALSPAGGRSFLSGGTSPNRKKSNTRENGKNV